ncbi:hypothetical protein NW762_002279 [Fusarium torreyae]|uniref:WSC domain-containing protein n=1 Tax=Fusarium torreyae TaxID=1237075 RepID=A0A9W8SCP7_9HYPO|nr:hypothetical protein NW762_002279 [Fusarium torreyae]
MNPSGREPDRISLNIGGQEYAVDFQGNNITAVSPYLQEPFVIKPPDSLTSYSGSSPPLSIDILASDQNFMFFAICDIGDASKDSALLVKVEGCVDCNTNIRLAYVTTTTIIGPGDTEVTSTIKASGTVSGTVVITRGEAETTTTEEPTTTTTEEFTTTTEDTTTEDTITTEDTTTATQGTTTTGDITTEDTTTTTIEDTTTATEEATTTGDTTTEYTTFTDYTTYTTFIEDTTTTEDTTTSTQETITTAKETTTTEGSTVASTNESLEAIETTIYPTSAATSDTTVDPTSDVTSTTEVPSTGTETTDISDLPIDNTTSTSSDIETSSEPTASIFPRQTTTDLLSASSATTDPALESSSVSATMLSSEITFDTISDTGSVTTKTTDALETATLQQTELSSTDTSPPNSIETPTETISLTEVSSDDSVNPTTSQTFLSNPSTTTLLSFLSTNPLSTPSSLDAISDSPLSSTVESASADITSTFTTSPAAPSNLAEIGSFRFFGCLGSPDGYPSFELIGEGPDMTTIECEKLSEGRTYMGLFLRSCYAADTLDSSDLVRNGRCDLPCPGDPGLFCGGLVNPDSRLEPRYEPHQGLTRRDAPLDILLTLYARVEGISGSSSLSGVLSTSEALSTFEVLTTPELIVTSELGPTEVSSASFVIPDSSDSSFLLALTNESSDLPIANPTNSLSVTFSQTLDLVDGLSTLSFVRSTASLSFASPIVSLDPPLPGTKSPGISPVTPPFPTSASYNAGNFSRTADLAPIVTTIVYTIVDPYDPSYLTVTEFCTTLRSPPCRHCHYQRPATVEMTTIQVDCNACGRYGEDSIVLNVPVGALLEPQTMDSYAYETIQVPYQNPNADAEEEESPAHRVRPSEKGPHSAQAHPPDEPIPGAGDEPHEAAPYEFDQTMTYDDIKPTAVGDVPHEVGQYEFDQLTIYNNIQPTTVGSRPQPTVAISHEQEPDIPVENKAAPKFRPVGETDQHESQREPGRPRPAIDPAPISPSTPPDSPIVIVSRSVQKVADGILMIFSLMTGIAFLL